LLVGFTECEGDEKEPEIIQSDQVDTEYFTGTVICVGNRDGAEYYFTVGKRYTFVNGTVIDDEGELWGDGGFGESVHSIEEWNTQYEAQFMKTEIKRKQGV